MTAKWVYRFGNGQAEGDAGRPDLLGGKGAGLAAMCRLGLAVPPGFTITTEACAAFHGDGRRLPAALAAEVEAGVAHIEGLTNRRFADGRRPLLLSVRPGAAAAMPGMMDTVLNIGLNDAAVAALAADAGDERFAWDSYRRFIQIYGSVVMGLDHAVFEEILEKEKARLGHDSETAISAAEWRDIVSRYKAALAAELDASFPDDPHEQLRQAIGAVFSGWTSARAVAYRQLHGIPAASGTAVNVQAMVFGNHGEESGTGGAFTRDPSTGGGGLSGTFLPNAQGEDVIAGTRPPHLITEAARIEAGSGAPSLEKAMPEVFAELTAACATLEAHCKDMQEIEFTVERGRLWLLQTRSGKRTVRAGLKIAVALAEDGLIGARDAILRVDPASLVRFLHPTLDPRAPREIIGTGLPASPGAATGEIVFTAEDVVALARDGRRAILVRVETTPEDVAGMHAADGVLTARGGMTGHAAVLARGMGKPCVSGAGALRVDARAGTLQAAGRTLRKGAVITLDGSSGEILAGAVPMRPPELSGAFGQLMTWADAARRMKVRANAETPADARAARAFGAEGIGLCRTEHMFFEAGRIGPMREMILADSEEGRRTALARLLPMQRSDFIELFKIMAGLPVAIRLLDPPLHEFLPSSEAEIGEVAASLGMDAAVLGRRIGDLAESNPMLGHRGCRLAISYPEIAEMQARAIFEAAAAAAAETGVPVTPEIMVPLVGLASELDFVKARIDAVAKDVARETGKPAVYLVGTMIELPRAALTAGAIAGIAEFFSFGTNDLTQTTLGISRDDAGGFLSTYLRKAVLDRDPFVSLDASGVGELIRMACGKGRAARPELKLGVCGEHGGDPASIGFFEDAGLDYVSCSPFRVPVARLAAAQAAIRAGR